MLGVDWRHDLYTWQTDDQVEHSRNWFNSTYICVCTVLVHGLLLFGFKQLSLSFTWVAVIVVTLVAENGGQQPRKLTQALCIGKHFRMVRAFTRFDICCDANEWDNDKRATKLPTLLHGRGSAGCMAGPKCRRKKQLRKS